MESDKTDTLSRRALEIVLANCRNKMNQDRTRFEVMRRVREAIVELQEFEQQLLVQGTARTPPLLRAERHMRPDENHARAQARLMRELVALNEDLRELEFEEFDLGFRKRAKLKLYQDKAEEARFFVPARRLFLVGEDKAVVRVGEKVIVLRDVVRINPDQEEGESKE